MAITRDNATRSARAQALSDARDGATIEIRTGSPSGLSDSEGTLLVVLTANATWGTVSNGVLTANPITSGVAVADGTAGHYLIKDGATVIESGLVDGSDGITLDNTSITTGQTVNASSWTNTEPQGA